MCIGELVGIGKKRSLTKIDSIVNFEDYNWTSSSRELDVWNSILQSTDIESLQTSGDIEGIRQLVRQVCRRRRPGRPPLYVFNGKGTELKNDEERKFMEKILKRRIRQNKAYRRRKERSASKQKATKESSQEVEDYTLSESVSKSSQVSTVKYEQVSEQPNMLSFISENDRQVDIVDKQNVPGVESIENQGSNTSICTSLEEDECLHLKHLWETEDQWIGIAQSGGCLVVLRLIFERVRETYLGLSMFLRDAYKSLSILPGYFDWRTACFIIGISPTSEQPGHSILESLLQPKILQSHKDYFLMGPLEKSFALHSSVVRSEPQYETVMRRAKERFVEYFLSKYFDINDYFFLQRGTANDIILSIYTNEKVNMDYCLKLILENDIAKILDINLLNRCVHFFRYCAAPETLIAIFKKALHQNACFQSLMLETCTESNSIARTTRDCTDIICPDSWEIEALARLKAAMGEAYCSVGDEEKGEYLLRQAVDLCGFHNIIDSPVVVMPLLYLANLEKKRTFYSTAAEKLQTAINILYRLGLRNSPFVAVALVSAALLDAQLGNMKFVKDSVAVIEELPWTKEIPEVNAFLGFSYQGQGKGDIAQRYFRTALEVIQRKEFSRNISELYIRHCGEYNLESILLSEIEDSSVEGNKESFSNGSATITLQDEPIFRKDSQSNCGDSLRCFCFDLGKIGKSLKKMFSFVLSYEDSSGYENTCVDDLLEDEDENEILFNHPFFIA